MFKLSKKNAHDASVAAYIACNCFCTITPCDCVCKCTSCNGDQALSSSYTSSAASTSSTNDYGAGIQGMTTVDKRLA